MIRRLTAALVLGIAVPVVALLSLGASDEGGGYKVRAVFDNVASAVPGEDVKIAGAKVGQIESMDVTPDNKAAVTLAIKDSGFVPFRRDARCTVRPQSLIGEKFVECEPGSSSEPELAKIPEGEPGAGEHELPLRNTSSPVDIDLINNIMRLPYRQRLAILLNEFGTGLAGRGKDLNEVIHRANPALRETDDLLAILARQNQVLADLARDSDTALAPLARERVRVGDFIERANETAEATAERRGDIEGSIERLPRFLRELRPTMQELGALSQEMTPVLRDLSTAAPDLNRFVLELGPFSRNAVPALESLGEASEVGGPVLVRARPLVNDVRRFASDARPVSLYLDQLQQSLTKTGAINRVMDYIFFQMTAINGFDGISHYLRAALIVNLCSVYSIDPVPGCQGNFEENRSVRAAAASGKTDAHLANTRRALRKQKPRPVAAPQIANKGMAERLLGLSDPRTKRLRDAYLEKRREAASQPGGSPARNATEAAADYLLGNDG